MNSHRIKLTSWRCWSVSRRNRADREMAIIRDTFFPTPSFEYTFIGIYSLLCISYMTFGINSSSKLIKVTLKCLPLLFLILFFLYTVTSIHFGPMQGVGDPSNLERLLFGLLFSCLGDFYLVFDMFFMLGILAFASTQMIHIGLFNGAALLFYMPDDTSQLVTAAAIVLVSSLVYFCILPNLSRVLIIPAAIYCILISIAAWCAIVTMQLNPKLSTQQGALGACLFYTSDLLLSVNRWRIKLPYGPVLVIGTYYAAQILIFFSVINGF